MVRVIQNSTVRVKEIYQRRVDEGQIPRGGLECVVGIIVRAKSLMDAKIRYVRASVNPEYRQRE